MVSGKKIVFVGLNGYDFPETRVRCRNFAEALQQLGWDASVFSFREELLADRPETSMFTLPDTKREELVKEAIGRIEKMGPAILYVQKVHYHAAAPYYLSKKLGWPMVLDYDDYDLDRSPLFNDRTLCEKYFDAYGAKPVTGVLAAHSRMCIAASTPLHNLLSQWNRNTHLIETGVNTNRFAFRPGDKISGTRRLIWTGQIWGEPIMRSLELCFKTARILYRNNLDFSLDLFGRGNESETNLHLNRKYPNVPISYRGWVAPDRMAAAMADADAGFYPLVFSNTDYEWMTSKSPTKMFEYMATGIPVIAVDIAETRRVLDNGNAGLLCKDEFAMAESLLHLFNNPDYRNDLVAGARERVETHYSLEQLGNRLNAHLETIPL